MANFNIITLNSTGNFSGNISSPVSSTGATDLNINSSRCFFSNSNTSSIVKFSPGAVFGQLDETITFNLDFPITIYSPTLTDWTTNRKNNWFSSWMKKAGLESLIATSAYNLLFNDWELELGFEKISGASLNYVTQLDTGEVVVAINCFIDEFFMNWVNVNNGSNFPELNRSYAEQINSLLKPGYNIISNTTMVEYGGHTDMIWAFSGFTYKNVSYNLNTNNILTGGSNIIAEIKLAGKIRNNNGDATAQARYQVKKNVNANDPTKGLCSGQNSPFCVGDVLSVVDISTRTTRSNLTNNFVWNWFSDLEPSKNIWYIADVTNPCTDYAAVPIYDMLFPIRVISECTFSNFQ